MSPVSPAVVAPASMSGFSGLLSIPSGFVDIADFNGNATRLPPLTGPDRVGVHHFTLQHDLGFRFSAPAVCSNASDSLPQLLERYGEDAVLFVNETCSNFRNISASVFYPACESPQEPLLKMSPVFTQSLLETITAQVFGEAESVHNMDSHAFLDAPICPDKYPMIILSPPVGGQRQTYTQLASDMASHHHVVVTVDHAFQSGAIESQNGNVLFNLAGELLQPREANTGRVVDLMAVALHFNDSSNLQDTFWAPRTEIDPLNTFVFGHGQGGLIARMMVASNLLSAGGTLDNIIRMPAPYNERNMLYKPRHKKTQATKPQPTSKPGAGDDAGDPLGNIAGELGDSLGERLKNMARGLMKMMMDSFSSLICRVLGTCGTLVQRRELATPFYGREDWDDHEDKPCDDLCLYHCKLECKPSVPHGLFPDDLGQSTGKTRSDDGDWSDDWIEYENSIGDYKGFPGRNPYRHQEKSCYDDDYCAYRCCFNQYNHEYDDDWEDEHGKHRHYHEDQQNDNDWEDEHDRHRNRNRHHHEDHKERQDREPVPGQWQDEDEAPSFRHHGVENSPGSDEGAEGASAEQYVLPDDGNDLPPKEDDSPGDEDDDDGPPGDVDANDEESPGEGDGANDDDEGQENQEDQL